MLTAAQGQIAARRPTWHDEVRTFKRELIGRVLAQARGNRTHAARRLGIQRTYLLRLIRNLDIVVPAAPDHPGAIRRSHVSGASDQR